MGQSEGSSGRTGDVLRTLDQQLQRGVEFRFFKPAAPIRPAANRAYWVG
jgi:hypothetical protein